MKPQKVSLISIVINFILGIVKIIFGFLTASLALIADGVHSGLDVISSFVTYLGLKTAKKPADEEHPYGHFKAEDISGFIVAILLGITGIWMLFESIHKIFIRGEVKFSISAIIVIAFVTIITEILARIKFYYGEKFQSISLVADAEHSRADVLSSASVLIGLILVKYFNLADALVALGISCYILFRAFKIGREITDTLMDVSNKDVEERIRKICERHNIEISSLRTRKIGGFNFAEIKIKVPPTLKVKDAQKIIEILEERLLSNIKELNQVVISIEAYNLSKTVVLSRLGKRIGELRGFEKIGPKKRGKRIIIPLEGNKISDKFGASKYLVIDKKEDRIIFKKIIKNPYYTKEFPYGARFAKAIRADKVLTKDIGPNAKQNLENFGIEVEIISDSKELKNLL